MGIITQEPPELERRVQREALLELKRLNDSYCRLAPDQVDLFESSGMDPTQLYQDHLLTPKSVGNPLTIEEPSSMDFYQYGLECRYLPLYRYLQVSRKAVLTADWHAARQELCFSRAFDRLLELRNARACSLVLPKQPIEPPRRPTQWDTVLEQARWMYIDMAKEKKWKQEIAKELIEEAVLFLKLRFKLKQKVFHYLPEMLNYLDRETVVYGDTDLPNTEPPRNVLCKTSQQWSAQDAFNAMPSTPTLPTLPDDEYQPNDLDWTDEQDAFLKRAASLYNGNLEIVADAIGRSFEACRHRLSILIKENAEPSLTAAARHHSLSMSMQSSFASPPRIRPPLTISQAAKKLQSASSSVHPSHEAAVRKANQNINKLLTPGELALRRLQRNRVVMAGDLTGRDSSQPATPVLKSPK